MHDETFRPARKFGSFEEAFKVLSDQYALRQPVLLELGSPSRLTVLNEAPRYLFRGEPGRFKTTLASVHRRETYALRDGRQLSRADMQSLKIIWPDLLQRFSAPGYSLDTLASLCLLEHYGLPTWIVNFTRRLEHAFSFAAGSDSNGEVWRRLAVLPIRSFSGKVMNLSEHGLAVRARRQEAFGVEPDGPVRDLKTYAARTICNISWYEFPVSDSERTYWKNKLSELLCPDDDPTAGNMRYEVTQYIEEYRLSPAVTEWLLEKVPCCVAVPPVWSLNAISP